MTNDTVQPLGPLFGSDFITIEIDDQTRGTFALEEAFDPNLGSLNV